MSATKPFTLYGSVFMPNPFKVAVVLEELGLEYNVVTIDIKHNEHKGPEFTKLNPNGRVPALVDHNNNDFTVWESDAILIYLVDKYDPEHKLSVAAEAEKFALLQWLFFQASGQGPYFGQVGFFKRYHPEHLPSAIQRFQKEILRVFGVLDSVLSKQEWLVGGKLTIADLSFIPWNQSAMKMLLGDVEGVDVEKQFPALYKWHQKLIARPVVNKFIGIQAEAFKQFQADVAAKNAKA